MAAGYAAALAAGGVLFAYTKAFFTSPLHREGPHALPVGEQYINERERMLALIEELEQITFEPATIRARDGLTDAITTCATARRCRYRFTATAAARCAISAAAASSRARWA